MVRHFRLLSVLALASLAVLLSLGTWQVQRLYWKEALLAKLRAGIEAPPVAFESATRPSPDADKWEGQFQRVTASGSFDHAATRYVYAFRNGSPGYLVFTPLKLTGGGAVFVNRGFVEGPPNDTSRLVFARPEGTRAVSGITRRPDPPSQFDPAPDRVRGIWFANDVSSMADCAAAGIDCSRYIEADTSGDAPGAPAGRDPSEFIEAIPNSHLGYAITWYGLALALVAVYGFFVRAERRKT